MEYSDNERLDILKRYIPVADMIAATFGSNCEVVIHDLKNLQSSLIYITGNVTGRKLGAPTTEVIVRELRRQGDDVKDMLGLTAQTRDGKFIKTSTSFIRDPHGKVIGFLGINFDITAFTMVNSIISEFSAAHDMEYIGKPFQESYAQTVEEVFENLIENTLREIGVPIADMKKEDKVLFVKKLEENGAFLIHGAVDRISEVLGVTKQTIYNYLDIIR
ncbi:transcriptional regulator [Siminovitchia sp. 179-K 8D1 HS]|uniref:helix-turn-helix transcriptional regulator n=1 Tax=Siminovitchia sp. 179-K 8D1 HS TaxID=3142385 RepID=UPI0039A291FD